ISLAFFCSGDNNGGASAELAVHTMAIIRIPTNVRHQREIPLSVTCNVGRPVVNVLLRLLSQIRDRWALLVDVLLGVESSDQRLDALFLCIRRSGSLCLLGVTGRAPEIAGCRFNASLSEISINALWKAFGDVFENLHCFSTLLLIL